MTNSSRYVIFLKSGEVVTSPNSVVQNVHPYFFSLAALKVYLCRWSGDNGKFLDGATVEIWEPKSEHPISAVRQKIFTK